MNLFINRNFPNILFNCRFFGTSSAMNNAIVTVKEGKLQGTIQNLPDGTKYYSFKGIPYAQPPIGKLRFMAPKPLMPWNGILKAIDHGPVCPQTDLLTRNILEGSENCLFLNIYTQSLQSDSKIPVMIFIHGGGFQAGSGNSDMLGPEFLIQHNVILVTINYRLEAFGFLCLDIPEVPGNAGLKDQIAAFYWIKNNIAQFGGDPENITIFGESAGGASVTYHMISPIAKGLFQKAIAQSGTFLADWAFQDNAKENAFKIGKYLGNNTNDPYELLEFLQSVPSNKLAGITYNIMTREEKVRGMPIIFTPVVEKEFSDCEAFLNRNPINMLMSGKIKKIPFLTGYTTGEGLISVPNELKKLEVKNKFPSYFLPKQISMAISEDKAKELGDRIKQFYFENRDITQNETEQLAIIGGLQLIVYDIYRFLHFYTNVCETVYMYRFNLVSDLNLIKIMLGLEASDGACHADDVFYIFNNINSREQCQEQKKLRDHVYMVTKFWADFAKTGNPTPDNTFNFKWNPYTKSGREYLRIDETLSMGTSDDKIHIDFWNKLFIDAGLPGISKSSL
ncbi:juvenile hormone esterase-like isoform X1 [Vanessa atalanta]|uniref:juvenile hormone esterase-like isoform X1 n=2 Tax=Vanessa atalanta TaxID=42275 RepID=UPI001FCE1D78|nr:juvenile hormone esterase-like isoform X1 [Vanessa atalanta]